MEIVFSVNNLIISNECRKKIVTKQQQRMAIPVNLVDRVKALGLAILFALQTGLGCFKKEKIRAFKECLAITITGKIYRVFDYSFWTKFED